MSSVVPILLVEDARDTQAIVRAVLGAQYQVTIASTAEEAKLRLREKKFALAILDIGLPDEDGFALCAQIRADVAFANLPIIFLSGKSQTGDKVAAFALGADDYVVKPLVPAEFKARVEAKLRRQRDETDQRDSFLSPPFRVVLPQQRIYLATEQGESDLGLSVLEFKLLYYFLRHEDHVLSREQILAEVWGHETNVSDRAVDTYVYSLRRKLGDLGVSLKSIPRAGYRYSRAVPVKAAA